MIRAVARGSISSEGWSAASCRARLICVDEGKGARKRRWSSHCCLKNPTEESHWRWLMNDAFTHKRVLVVEDDTLVGIGLKSFLEKLGHTVVGEASTAEEAEKRFAETKPDIVLLDIRLNEGDGIDLAKRLL